MGTAVFLKNNLKNIHPTIGKLLNHIKYEKRPGLGKVYKLRKKEILLVETFTSQQKKAFVFAKIRNLVIFAYENIKFYKEYYDSTGFNPIDLKSFDDIQKIPVITKAILNQYALEDRSCNLVGRYIVNTGGSSGNPFGFYILPNSMGHEWAHMHNIWENLDYKCSDFKLVFGGRSDVKKLVEYDVVRNHFSIDIYSDFNQVSHELIPLLKKYKIKFLHGYPSSIYEFAKYCKNENTELTNLLKKNLKGVFLGSEYPHDHYRKVIEEVFDVKTISWYGHTERAILAFEKEKKFEYQPFLSYGYTEIIENENKEFDLIGTSYYNNASPLIRYNTEDTIQNPVLEDSILKSFEILKGREGEFVIDKNNVKVNLTGLIFGRHHKLFNYSKFIQVKQIEIGVIEIYFVSDSIEEVIAKEYFDSKNLNFDISFHKISEPIRTLAGKINLLIK